MGFTVEEMIEQLDAMIDAMAYDEDRLLNAIEIAQQLRDELSRITSEEYKE